MTEALMQEALMNMRRTRPALLAALVVVTMLLSSGPAMADKLVIFKNGKALLVKAAEKDGQWIKCDFGGDDWLSVPASSIAEVTEAELDPAGRAAGAPNQVVQGETRNYSSRGSQQNDRRQTRSLNRGNDQDDVQAEAAAGAARRAPARSTARTARTNQQNNPLIPGLTPLNTNQNQPGRSGLLQRRGRFSDRDQAAEVEEPEEQEDDN